MVSRPKLLETRNFSYFLVTLARTVGHLFDSQHLVTSMNQNMRQKRPPEQVSVLGAVRGVSQAPEKPRVKDSGGPKGASGKGDTEWFRRDGPAGKADAEHGCGDRKQPTQSCPGPGKVVLLRRDPTASATISSSTTTKRLSPKKKVEWIPYTPAPSSPVLSSVWIYRERMKRTQQREASRAAPTDQLGRLSLKDPFLLPMDTESSGAGEGSGVLGLRAASYTESRAGLESQGQEHWGSGWPASEGQEAEARPESPSRDGGCWYSTSPPSSKNMMPFRRKKSTNLQPSVSWADDDYWASWDGWNEVINWEANGPSRRRGRNRNREGKRNSHSWGDTGCQR